MSAESAREAMVEEVIETVEQEVTEETERVVQADEVVQEEQKEAKEAKTEEEMTFTPTLSQGEREGAVRAEHPAGEVFFRGSNEEVTEGEAEEIARRQLARSGLLRGQKVRVAD